MDSLLWEKETQVSLLFKFKVHNGTHLAKESELKMLWSR
jgi:hypothetical protein